MEEIKGHLEEPTKVDPAGKDFYGLTALQKFASWNKTAYLSLLVPKLTASELNSADNQGKTRSALGRGDGGRSRAVRVLVEAGVDRSAKDGKGRTVEDVLDGAEPSGVIDRLRKAVEGG